MAPGAPPAPRARPLDAFVDHDGLHVTGPDAELGRLAAGLDLPGPAPRSVPGPAGARPGPAVAVPAAAAPDALRRALDGPVTARLVALARLAAHAGRLAARGEVVPAWTDGGLAWLPAPGPTDAARARALVDEAAAASAAAGGRPAVATWYATLVTAAAPRASGELEEALRHDLGRRDVRALGDWSERVRLRRAAGARLALRLDDDEDAAVWSLLPVAISLAEASTRVALADAVDDPALLDPALDGAAGRAAVEAMAEREWATARDACGALGPAPVRTELSDDEVVALLGTAGDLAERGVELLAPSALLRPASLRARAATSGTAAGLDAATLSLAVTVDVDGHPLDGAELAALATAKTELVRLRGRWVRVRAADRERALRLVARARRPVSAADLATGEVAELGADDLDVGAVDGWVGDVLRGEWSPGVAEHVEPTGLAVPLRPYQHDGLDWLSWLAANGLGGVLADDMGLGKTAQLLAAVAADHAGPTLVVCPTSVVTNWVREATKFTPELRVVAHHGAGRATSDVAVDADLVVTTYGLLRRDPQLRQVAWHRVVLDEAQAIKNPASTTARAARALDARHRVAVTGTPVENHLGDLWSLMRFAQPGLLGSREAFRRRHVAVRPDEDEAQAEERLARLRRLIAPFVLRRTKTDPGVAPDLPPRIVEREDCGLTREQIGLYEAVVAQLVADAGAERGQRRRGAILAGIAKLKQICVHPALLTEPVGELRTPSGKTERLGELVEEILGGEEAVLVFSQFASVLPALAAHLAARTGREVLHLTGAMTARARQRTVDAFSADGGPPVLCVSLRAGGTGLNLVRASHVIHLDRWWNPAVEDQASDRAWRIGQRRTVVVHNLVCPGTLEDRIDTLLTDKRAAAAAVIRSTGRPVTELGADELGALVGLVRSEVVG